MTVSAGWPHTDPDLEKFIRENAAGLYGIAPSDQELSISATERIKDRLAPIGKKLALQGGNMILAHVRGNKVFTFYVIGDASGVIECNADMFPSDELVGQLRLVML